MVGLLGLAQSQPIRIRETPVVEWNAEDTLELIDYSTVLSWTSGLIVPGNQWLSIDSIEERLGRHPSVQNVEASLGINGQIRIQIDQRDPLLRLLDSLGHQNYLDKTSKLMPALVGIPARLPVVTGLDNLSRLQTDSSTLNELMVLANGLYSDPFWWSFADQISIHPNYGFVLCPKIGQHQILLGSATSMEGKLNKLKYFYTKGLHPTDWDSYSIVDGRYKGQVVCQPSKPIPLPVPEPMDSLMRPDTNSILPNSL